MTATQHKIRISIAPRAQAGDALEIKTLISHPMESGFRRDQRGEPIARNILTRFECHFHSASAVEPATGSRDSLVFACDLHPGMAANPFISFHARATASGTFTFRWVDQHGVEISEARSLLVSDSP